MEREGLTRQMSGGQDEDGGTAYAEVLWQETKEKSLGTCTRTGVADRVMVIVVICPICLLRVFNSSHC